MVILGGWPFLVVFWNSVFRLVYLSFSPLPLASLLFSTICKASSDNHFAFLHFFFLGMVLITASYTMLWTSLHSPSGTLSDLILRIYLNLNLFKILCLLRNVCVGQEATVRSGHGTTDWFQIGKGLHQGWYCHPAYLTYMQSISCEMPGWMKHKLESRLLGEISITSDRQMPPPLGQKVKKN